MHVTDDYRVAWLRPWVARLHRPHLSELQCRYEDEEEPRQGKGERAFGGKQVVELLLERFRYALVPSHLSWSKIL